jgi:hypothetical protein
MAKIQTSEESSARLQLCEGRCCLSRANGAHASIMEYERHSKMLVESFPMEAIPHTACAWNDFK